MADSTDSEDAQAVGGNQVGKPSVLFVPPMMSWENPIEEEILYYVRLMKQHWQIQVHGSIWRSVNKAAENYVSAYAEVEKHILWEMRLRSEIKAMRQEEVNDL